MVKARARSRSLTIITKISIFVTLKIAYVHVVPQCRTGRLTDICALLVNLKDDTYYICKFISRKIILQWILIFTISDLV